MSEAGTEARSSAAPLKAVAKLAASIACVTLALIMVDRAELSTLLRRADAKWILSGVVLSVAALGAQAWRWSFIARRMRLVLSFRGAFLECYLGALLNQTLPTGYAGESVRVVRLTRENRQVPQATMRALLTVILDRLSGQWILWLSIALSVPLWVRDGRVAWLSGLLAIAFAAASIALVRAPARILPRRIVTEAQLYLDDVRDALWSRGAWAIQLSTSLASVFGCLAVYFCALRALSLQLSGADFLRVAPLMLAATSLPISFAGWGPREIASAALFAQIGLDKESGTAASILYGLISLVSCLPGALAWWRR